MSGSSPTATASELTPTGPPPNFDDDRFQNALVHFVEAVLVNFQHGQRLVGDGGGDAAVVP